MNDYFEVAVRRLGPIDALEADLCSGCADRLQAGDVRLVRIAVPGRDTALWFHRECFEQFLMGLEVFGHRLLEVTGPTTLN